MRWYEDAACLSADPTLFDPDSSDLRKSTPLGRRMRFAFAYCCSCPVAAACLADALANSDSGVRGGLLLDEGQPIAVPTWENPGPGNPPHPCGTERAWQRHRRWGEEPCDECQTNHDALKAYNLAQRRRVAAHRRMTGAA